MTQPNAQTENQRALAANASLAGALAEGFAEALQPLTVLLRGEMLATRSACEELVAAVDRLTAVIAAQAAGDIDPDDAPDIEMPLERFHNFDWSQVGAQILAEDEFGPAIVSYGGKAFKRRAPDNAYGAAIWFSRAVGKNEDGTNKYVRLITFKPLSDKVEPMGRKVERAVAGAPAQSTTAPQPRPAAATTNTSAEPPSRQSAAPAPAQSAPATARPAVDQPMLSEEPEWPERAPSAEEEFNSWPSGSDGKPPLQPKPQQVGPRVSGGAAHDDTATAGGAPAGAQPAATPAAKPAAKPAAPPPGRRQATIGGGEVYATFTKWGNDFARRYPHYRVAKTDRTDFYHLQVSLYSLGETEDHRDSRYAYIKDLELLTEAIAAMEKHAAANHSS